MDLTWACGRSGSRILTGDCSLALSVGLYRQVVAAIAAFTADQGPDQVLVT